MFKHSEKVNKAMNESHNQGEFDIEQMAQVFDDQTDTKRRPSRRQTK